MRDSRPKVLQIGNYPPPLCGWSMHTQLLHDALLEAGAESMVLDIGPSRTIKNRGCEPTLGGIDYFVKLLRYRARGYTFHAHVNGDSWKGYLLALSALLLGQFTGRPGLLTFHAGPVQQRFPRQRGFWFWAFRALFRSSGQIICNHEPVRSLILEYGVAPNRVHAIPAFSVQYGHPSGAPLPAAIDAFLASRAPVVFSYALFRPEFTIELLMQTAARLKAHFPTLGLLIVGPRDIPHDVAALIATSGLSETVLVAGNLNHEVFLETMRRCAVVVRTHLRDGVCSSVLEALSQGLPVVAAEDGIRPPSVVTYDASRNDDLFDKLSGVLVDLDAARNRVIRPPVIDHLASEVEVVLKACSS